MNKQVEEVLKSWKTSLERYGKLDVWKMEESLSVLSKYLRTKEDTKHIRNLVRQIRDKSICPSFNVQSAIEIINNIFDALNPVPEVKICLLSRRNYWEEKKEGQEFRFRSDTKRIFGERLRFRNGMLLRNFDIETESACDSRKVRRIIEKRMCQAYHRKNKRCESIVPSNRTRYWSQRATSYQLYNIGQIEHVRFLSRGESTHWKRMFDHQTGQIVFKKKMAYPTELAAMEAIEIWKINHPEDNREMHAYKCHICHKWHIGHDNEMNANSMGGVGIAS